MIRLLSINITSCLFHLFTYPSSKWPCSRTPHHFIWFFRQFYFSWLRLRFILADFILADYFRWFILADFRLFYFIWLRYSCMFKHFIIIVHLFITFLQALVHWFAYESCFVGSVISKAWVSGSTMTDHLFVAGRRIFKH